MLSLSLPRRDRIADVVWARCRVRTSGPLAGQRFSIEHHLIIHVHQRFHELILVGHSAGGPVEREHVVEVVLVELMARTLAFEHLPDEALLAVFERLREMENAPLRDNVVRIGCRSL